MDTVQQIKSAHHSEGKGLSLKAFARERGVLAVITKAHKLASKPRSDKKREKTRAMIAARKSAKK